MPGRATVVAVVLICAVLFTDSQNDPLFYYYLFLLTYNRLYSIILVSGVQQCFDIFIHCEMITMISIVTICHLFFN